MKSYFMPRFAALALLALGFIFFIQSSMAVISAAWSPTNLLANRVEFHTATLLPDGTVLICGGIDPINYFLVHRDLATNWAQIYDPNTSKWTNTTPMVGKRYFHTATLLLNGKVLVAGGTADNIVPLTSSELYDPLTRTWSNAGDMNAPHMNHTATLLQDGRVLIAGGPTNNAATELYDPIAGTWTLTGSMSTNRTHHTATLLTNGTVLVVGGDDNRRFPANVISSCEIYNPATGLWTPTSPINPPRSTHTATLLLNGKVLVAGGTQTFPGLDQIYDPVTGNWATNANVGSGRTATLLPDGHVIVMGPSYIYLVDTSGNWTEPELSGSFPERDGNTATLLANGDILLAGGNPGAPSSQIYNPGVDDPGGKWTTSGSVIKQRNNTSINLLPNGKVLVPGSADNGAEIYDPTNGTWSNTGPLSTARTAPTGTLLPNGKVLIAGGVHNGNIISDCELYDYTTGTFTNTASMLSRRYGHNAVLLTTGKVLVAGGITSSTGSETNLAEIYDPVTETWIRTGDLNLARQDSQAAALLDGRVLLSGGVHEVGLGVYVFRQESEIYDPITGLWTVTGALAFGRENHTTTLLPNGKVLVAGGTGTNGITATAELFDPATGMWTNTGSLNAPRKNHTATLLPNGKVLIAGGYTNLFTPLATSTELYDPATGRWTTNYPLSIPRLFHMAVLLPSGKVLIAEGNQSGNQSELYDPGLAPTNNWPPQITNRDLTLTPGQNLVLGGSQFRGKYGGSGNYSQDSSSEMPIVQLRSLENSQTLFLLATNWSTNSYASAPLGRFPAGYAMATMFVNGMAGPSTIVNIQPASPLPTTLMTPIPAPNGTFQFSFTNNPGALFGISASTNLVDWTSIDGVIEASPGQYQFTDPQAANGQRFYRIFSP